MLKNILLYSSYIRATMQYPLQSTLSRTDTFGTGVAVRLREMSVSQIEGERKAGTNSRCPFYRGVRLIEVSVKRGSTVHSGLY